MNYFSIIPLLAFIASLFTSALILGKNVRQKEHRAFLLFSLALQVWAAFDFVHWNMNKATGMSLMKLQCIAWLSVGFLFINFIYVFLGKPKGIIYKVFGAGTFVSIAIAVPTDLVIQSYKSAYWGMSIVPGKLFFPVIFIMISHFFYALYLIFSAYRKSIELTMKRQLVLLFIGTVIAIGVGITTDILMPYVWYIDFPGLSSTASVFQSVLIFVAVTQYRFLSLGIPEFAEELFHNMNDAVIVMNGDGDIVNSNPAAKKMMGSDLYHIDLSKTIGDYSLRTVYDSVETVIIVNSSVKTVQLTQSPVRQLGKIEGWILIIKDITAKKQIEMELVEKNKELDTFVYKASHDLKGPLSSIKGLVALSRESIEDRAALSYLDMIEKTAGRLDKVLLDLLQVTKIKKSDMVPGKIVLKKLVNEILESLQYDSGYRKVSITVYCDENATVCSDLNSVNSILQNLIVNAINYRNPESFASWVDIIINTKENGVEIVIADNGIGIPYEQQERIFEMFYRASNRVDGTGLGLYIVKNALARLGGTVRVESKVDSGTTFFIFIPDAGPQLEMASVSGESKLSLTGAA